MIWILYVIWVVVSFFAVWIPIKALFWATGLGWWQIVAGTIAGWLILIPLHFLMFGVPFKLPFL